MPRRRASPKVEGKSGRSKLAQAASAAGPYDGESNFPIDDLPPDDLPVRDIAEDQEEWRPAHSMAIRAADLAGRDLADPVHVPNTDSPEPRTTLSGSGQPTSSAALRPEPAVETSAPDPQPEADPSTLQAQYLLPGFGSGNSVEAQLDPGGKQAMRPRRPRGSTTKRALSFAQIELWRVSSRRMSSRRSSAGRGFCTPMTNCTCGRSHGPRGLPGLSGSPAVSRPPQVLRHKQKVACCEVRMPFEGCKLDRRL